MIHREGGPSRSTKRSKAIDTVPLPEKVVRVAVPAKVAFDLGSMQKVTKAVLGRLGCPECHSGFDIRFDMIRRFQFDEKLSVHDVALGEGISEG